jgi:hypothetical protein
MRRRKSVRFMRLGARPKKRAKTNAIHKECSRNIKKRRRMSNSLNRSSLVNNAGAISIVGNACCAKVGMQMGATIRKTISQL